MSDRLKCLKNVDDYRKLQPTKFWKYVSAYRKNNSSSAQPDVNGTCVVESGEVAESSVKYFKSIYSNSFSGEGGSYSVVLPSGFQCLPLEMDTLKAVKPLNVLILTDWMEYKSLS
jgi:hypothetical protein